MDNNLSDIKTVLGLSLVHKYLTDRLLRFVDEQGISRLFASMDSFTLDAAIRVLQKDCGYVLHDKVRLRMVKVLIDFLCECGYADKENSRYFWKGGNSGGGRLSTEESAMANEYFRGQIDFFERCILHAVTFLRDGLPLFGFDNEATHIWEHFLGNAEFNFARSVLAKVMLSGKGENAHILDLCYGPGFDILQIQKCFAEVKVTAIDFKDIFRGRALSRIPNPDAVCWVDAKHWGGFGTKLPFPSDTFDAVFFACADPYIAEELREFVYRDIFRVLKSGGSLNILSHSYPDPGRRYVEEQWVRRGTLCHDFAESVCEGWHGFYDAKESVDLFESIGYRLGTVMMNSSIWGLDKP
ncbi:MAG: class I SAM-dependent methyltransferase [Dissulfurispiraceae bacterium]